MGGWMGVLVCVRVGVSEKCGSYTLAWRSDDRGRVWVSGWVWIGGGEGETQKEGEGGEGHNSGTTKNFCKKKILGKICGKGEEKGMKGGEDSGGRMGGEKQVGEKEMLVISR